MCSIVQARVFQRRQICVFKMPFLVPIWTLRKKWRSQIQRHCLSIGRPSAGVKPQKRRSRASRVDWLSLFGSDCTRPNRLSLRTPATIAARLRSILPRAGILDFLGYFTLVLEKKTAQTEDSTCLTLLGTQTKTEPPTRPSGLVPAAVDTYPRYRHLQESSDDTQDTPIPVTTFAPARIPGR